MDEDANFLHYYQENLFKECDNLFQTAELKRKCLTQKYHTAVSRFENDTTCFMLEKDLRDYSNIVDDRNKGGVNNYADLISSISSNSHNQNRAPMVWKSGINLDSLAHLIKPFPHENNANCLLKINKENVLSLTTCKNHAVPTSNKNELVHDIKKTENETQQKFVFASQSNPNHSFKFKSINKMNSPALHKPEVITKSSSSNDFNKPNTDHYKNTNSTKYSFNKLNVEPRPLQKEGPKICNNFRTAKDELVIQNAKKNQTTGNSQANKQQTMFNYGSNKKSLGGRRTVQNKFIPPINQPEEEKPKSFEEDTEQDERLKNIDPKMVELIRSEIIDSGSPITWDDIAGLEFAKNTIQEIVVWPLLRPDIFTGLRRPPKGILLFGPPGTGKTLIGKCIASQSHSTFFSISASSLTSKWIGDGEKMVRALFAVAKCHQPAVIFIDEIDSLLTQRSDTEHESSRRMKTEFLVQLDGAATGEEERILIIGATNRPQELDEAARRRLVKRLYIPLPEFKARQTIVERLMRPEKNILSEQDIRKIAELTDGYSGADMKNLCAEASLGPIRSINLSMIDNIHADEVRPISFEDFESALNRVRASVSNKDLEQYLIWDKTYGSGAY